MSNQSLREAAQQALEALNRNDAVWPQGTIHHKLAQALAQPDDKAQPVAVVIGPGDYSYQISCPQRVGTKLYAAPQPPAEQGAELSDSDIMAVMLRWAAGGTDSDGISELRALFAADRAARGGAA